MRPLERRTPIFDRPAGPRPDPAPPPGASGRVIGGLERVAAVCEIRDCGQRADFFWAWGVMPHGSWLPLCAPHASDLAEHIEPFPVAAVAETAAEPYLASDHS